MGSMIAIVSIALVLVTIASALGLVIARGVAVIYEANLPKAPPMLGLRGEIILEHGPGERALEALVPVTLAALALTYFLAPFSSLVSSPHNSTTLAAILAAIAAVTVRSALRVWGHILVTESTVASVPRWGREISIPWSEVTRVTYSRWLGNGLQLRANDERVIQVNPKVRGFSAFLSFAEQRLPYSCRDALKAARPEEGKR